MGHRTVSFVLALSIVVLGGAACVVAAVLQPTVWPMIAPDGW